MIRRGSHVGILLTPLASRASQVVTETLARLLARVSLLFGYNPLLESDCHDL